MKSPQLMFLVLMTILAVSCKTDRAVRQENEFDYTLGVCDSIGIELGEPKYMLGTFTMCCDASGDILVLDTSCRSVRKFDSFGVHIQTVDLAGSGPGEFMAPDEISPVPRGGFVVSSRIDRKAAFYDDEMKFIREMNNTSSTVMGPHNLVALNDTTVLCSFSVFAGDSVSGVLSVHSVSLDDADRLIQRKTVVFENNPSWSDEICSVFTVSRNGTIYAVWKDISMWRIERFSEDGSVLPPIEREYLPVPMSIAELLHDRDIYMRRYTHANGTRDAPAYKPAGYLYAIEELYTDNQGRLWVQSGGRLASGFDVYSPEGEFLFHCSFNSPDWQSCDEWRFSITPGGFLAVPINPECYPLLYMIDIETE